MTLFVNIAVLVLITGSVFFSDASTTIERHLFAISANNGGEGRPVLRYAESDAKSFAKVLTEMGGIAPGNKILLREPSVKEIQNEFATLGKKLSVKKSMAQEKKSSFIIVDTPMSKDYVSVRNTFLGKRSGLKWMRSPPMLKLR